MAVLCLDTSLEMLQPLCHRRMHHLQGYLCHCLHKGSLLAHMAVVMLLAHHILQNSPQFIVQGFEVCTPRGPILGTDEGQKVPLQALLSCLGLVDRSWVLLEDPFLTTDKGHVKTFHNSLIHSDTSCTPFLQKWRCVTPHGTPPTKPWCRKGDGLLAPSEHTSRDVWA